MAIHFQERVSEAPLPRADELPDFLESLHLPDGRLSAAQLETVVNAIAAHPELFEDLLVEDPIVSGGCSSIARLPVK